MLAPAEYKTCGLFFTSHCEDAAQFYKADALLIRISLLAVQNQSLSEEVGRFPQCSGLFKINAAIRQTDLNTTPNFLLFGHIIMALIERKRSCRLAR